MMLAVAVVAQVVVAGAVGVVRLVVVVHGLRPRVQGSLLYKRRQKSFGYEWHFLHPDSQDSATSLQKKA